MYRYVWLNLAFLFVAGILVICLRQSRLRQLGILLGGMLIATVLFDNVIIGLHIVSYSEAYTTGLKIGNAPVEDFAYTVVATVLMPLIWVKLRDR